jgi:hypothetical protein
MRTTLQLQDQLVIEAKQRAAETGRTLTKLVEDAIRLELGRADNAQRPPYRIEAVGGRGLQPGVDLDDSAALLDLMEDR